MSFGDKRFHRSFFSHSHRYTHSTIRCCPCDDVAGKSRISFLKCHKMQKGVAVGALSMLVTVYQTEIATKLLRAPPRRRLILGMRIQIFQQVIQCSIVLCS
jgi:hypothetical protein